MAEARRDGLRRELRAAEAPRRAIRDHQIVARDPRDGAIQYLERLFVGFVDFLDAVATRDLQADMPLFSVGGFKIGADGALLLADMHPAVGIADQLRERRASGEHEPNRSH